ncbi:4-hydroxy-tetrahydrodipicolinate synthase [Bradyrhizobium sp. NP1]|uniref:4-hydroxy-tetrahydrodipicolinate synthase n=1 Tax=Bradyrhizobium sp. NP1 TaxID=3049772 RepID=UPI0025A519BE|nr:4-hydroxy-tetrahydrodipicolinate synthase [Bradyrhizobium sp. NP1]WJR77181.1 4-hydroxy-tetrahydrodipicolinate synthase [Bradyrhizobium sp. NP1]
MTTAVDSASWLTGYIPDLPTPFDAAGGLDLEAFARLCARQIEAGVPAVVVCETAGEASTLTLAERKAIIRTAAGIARGRARIIAGAGSNATARAIELAHCAEAAGADAVLSVVPYYNKPMQAGIYQHFRAIADDSRLPIIIHDAPARTVRELADDTLAKLAQSSRFVALRDGAGDVGRPLRLAGLLRPGFRLLSGHDATALGYIAGGGDGCISAVSNVMPDLCQAIFTNLKQGRPQAARHLFRRLIPLQACLADADPAALKYALSLLGLLRPDSRLPIVEPDDAAKAVIARAVAGVADEDLAWAAEA